MSLLNSFRGGIRDMPLYQFWCDKCLSPFEVTMTIATLDEYDEGEFDIKCELCGAPLRKIMCPPRRIKVH